MDPFRPNFSETSKEKLLILRSFEEHEEIRANCCCCLCFKSLKKIVKTFWKDLGDFSGKAWEMGRTDPRKAIFAVKMGLALAIVSLLIFWKDSYHNIDQYSVWAILTVIVMFEFSIGATLIKGFNRGLGTLIAGILALFFAQLSLLAPGRWGEVVIVISVFIVAFFASYLKLYPTMKPYEYGFRVFVLTYCILMIAGHRTGQYNEAVITRLILIALGAGVCLVVNICIFPIWSGEDLHNLVAKNFKGVASALEGCVNGYLQCVEYERIPSKILTYQAAEDPLYKGYRSVVQSTSQEETLLGFAIWEPPHGRYRKHNYPWENYVKVSGALRHCAFTVMALHGCILSEIQAPAERRQVFRSELQKVGAEGAKVLRHLGNKLEKMEKLGFGFGSGDILREVHDAAEQLQKKIDHRSYLLVNSQSWEIGRMPQDHHQDVNQQEFHQNLDHYNNSKENQNNNNNNNNDDDDQNKNDSNNLQLGFKSLSETVLILQGSMARTPPGPPSDHQTTVDCASFMNHTTLPWPLRQSFSNGDVGKVGFDDDDDDEKRKTYESASALSLATFASLLIEFVARLQNVVDSFEELSEKAEFKGLITNNNNSNNMTTPVKQKRSLLGFAKD